MRRAMLAILASTALAIGSTAANATAYIGSTTGCFGAGCTPGLVTTTTGGLTFNQGIFNQNDSNGFLAIGSGNPTTDTLGLFTLTGLPWVYNNTPFTLFVAFTQPGGLIGSYFALLDGNVSDNNSGGVDIDFNNTPQLFTYAGGAFTLKVNDLSVSAGGVASPISGVIRAVPEPATWGLMLLGFGAIGLTMRSRRRRPALAQIA
jgi:hypothetical protein